MPVTLLCPRLSCRAILRVPDHVRGQRVRCCECGVSFIVPTENSKTPKGVEPTKPVQQNTEK